MPRQLAHAVLPLPAAIALALARDARPLVEGPKEAVRIELEQACPVYLHRLLEGAVQQGHGIENCSIVPNTINEMLCMGHRGVLRLFPVAGRGGGLDKQQIETGLQAVDPPTKVM